MPLKNVSGQSYVETIRILGSSLVLPIPKNANVLVQLITIGNSIRLKWVGSRLCCLTVSLSLSHWYPGSGVVHGHILKTKFILTRSKVKANVTVAQKWYTTLHHLKMHQHTKFWNSYLK